MNRRFGLTLVLAAATVCTLACKSESEAETEPEKPPIPEELGVDSTCEYAVDVQGRKQERAACVAEVQAALVGCEDRNTTLRCLAEATSPDAWTQCLAACPAVDSDPAGTSDAAADGAEEGTDSDEVAADAPVSEKSGSEVDAETAAEAVEAEPEDGTANAAEAEAEPSRRIVAIDAGGDATCVLFREGGVRCWGAAAGGSIPGATGTVSTPTALEVEGARSLAMTSADPPTDMGLRTYGSGYWSKSYDWKAPTRSETAQQSVGCVEIGGGEWHCWGPGGGVLDPSWGTASGPAHVAALDGLTALELVADMGCGLTSEGGVACWGDGARADRYGREVIAGERVAVGEIEGFDAKVTAIGGLAARPCAIVEDQTVRCWGSEDDPYRPRPVPLVVEASDVAGAMHRTCFWTRPGLECIDEKSGVKIDAMVDLELVAIDASNHTFCGWDPDGTPVCWGSNVFGRIPGAEVDVLLPQHYVNGVDGTVVDIAVGYAHVCALTAEDEVFCWGDNSQGQLGSGDTAPTSGDAPVVKVAGLLEASDGEQ